MSSLRRRVCRKTKVILGRGSRRERRGRWGRIMELCSDSPAYSTFPTCKYSIFMLVRLRRARGRHSWVVVSGKLQQFWLRLRLRTALPPLSPSTPLSRSSGVRVGVHVSQPVSSLNMHERTQGRRMTAFSCVPPQGCSLRASKHCMLGKKEKKEGKKGRKEARRHRRKC